MSYRTESKIQKAKKTILDTAIMHATSAIKTNHPRDSIIHWELVMLMTKRECMIGLTHAAVGLIEEATKYIRFRTGNRK